MLLFFILVLFIPDDQPVIQSVIFAICSFLMFGVILFSMRRMKGFLEHLSRRGVHPATKTIATQLGCLALVAVSNFISFITNLRFASECNDDVMAPSPSAIATKILSMVLRTLWRVITVTMLIVFLRQAKPLFPNEYKAIEKDLRQAFATEDDNVTLYMSNSDEEDDSEMQSLNESSGGALQNRA